jgi:4-hydroxy-tetrahydrodipicolinate synthase
LLDSLEIGASGCISATINVTGNLAAEIVDKWKDGEAAALQRRLTAIRETFDRYPLIEALKHMMAEHSGRKQWLNARPPVTQLSTEDGKQLQGELESLGFSM